MKVDGYTIGVRPGRKTRGSGGSATAWTRARPAQPVLRCSMASAYATALPGTYGRGAAWAGVSLYSPREMTALYQDPRRTSGRCWRWRGREPVTLFDEEMRTGSASRPSLGLRRHGPLRHWTSLPVAVSFSSTRRRTASASARWSGTGTGTCSPARSSTGIVEPLMVINERITEHTFQAPRERLLPGVQAALRPRLGAEDGAGRVEGRRCADLVPLTRIRPT
jgi:hypothetical protein